MKKQQGKSRMSKRFALVGAELPEQDVHSNYERTTSLRNALIKEGFSFVGVQNVSKGRISQMFLVTEITEIVVPQLIAIAKDCGQKALLIADENLNMEVVSTTSKERKLLGKFKSATKASASLAQFYITFIENGTSYYFVTPNKRTNHGQDSTNGIIQAASTNRPG